MKKKIALLLAAVMTITAPMTAFAGVGGYVVTPTPSPYEQTTLIVSDDVSGVTATPTKDLTTEQKIDFVVAQPKPMVEVIADATGNTLNIRNGSKIYMDVTNSQPWYVNSPFNSTLIKFGGGATYVNPSNEADTVYVVNTGGINGLNMATEFRNIAIATPNLTVGAPADASAYADVTAAQKAKYKLIAATDADASGIVTAGLATTIAGIDTTDTANSALSDTDDEAIKTAMGLGGALSTVINTDAITTQVANYTIGVSKEGGTSTRLTATMTISAVVSTTDTIVKTWTNTASDDYVKTYTASYTQADLKLPVGTQIELPLAVKTVNSGAMNLTYSISESGTSTPVQFSGYTLNTPKGDKSTTFSTADSGALPSGVHQVSLQELTIKENLYNSFGQGYFQVAVTPGHRFVADATKKVAVVNSNGVASWFLGYNKDRTIAYFNINSVNSNYTEQRTIKITGLTVERTGDYYYDANETIKVTVSNIMANSYFYYNTEDSDWYNNEKYQTINPDYLGYKQLSSGGTGITTATLTVGSFVNNGIYFGYVTKTEATPKPWSGQVNVITPKLLLQENAPHSIWFSQKVNYTLVDIDGVMLDGVKIAKVRFDNFVDIPGAIDRELSVDADVTTTTQFNRYTFNRTYVESVGYTDDQLKVGSLNVQFWLNISPNFVGEIFVQLGATGINSDTQIRDQNNNNSGGRVKIAEAFAPLTIETIATDVVIGHQTYKTADVKITENANGILRPGKTLTLSIDEFASAGSVVKNTNVYFNPGAKVTMEAGRFTTLTFNSITTNSAVVTINISKPSTGTTSTVNNKVNNNQNGVFTVSDLNVSINRSTPNGKYDLVVGGTGIAESYRANADSISAYFPVAGQIKANYVNVVTPGDTQFIAVKAKLTPGSNDVVVNGVAKTIAVKPFINEANRTMVPLRALATILGVPDKDIAWNEAKSTASITFLSQNGPKTVVFTNGSEIYTVNGVEHTLFDKVVNTTVKAEIIGGSFFIPFRELGEALGIDVAYESPSVYFGITQENYTAGVGIELFTAK